ncbi:MAG: ABC transporter ATP-binding protein [Actinomycetia bacterium]|nr:ABC transporter ATP-binding protein [Actinomycetes bacterium]
MIRFVDVTKRFGKTTAIDHLSLDIVDDGIYCLLGRNGAGKTTLMRLLAGRLAATDGQIMVDEKPIAWGKESDKVSFVEGGSEQFNMRVSDLIDSAASLQVGFDRDFALKMVDRFELDTSKKHKQLSGGMKTMLEAILALANNAPIVLLDEPTLGLDAIIRDRFNTMLLESYELRPRILIVATHLIDEIAKITEQLIIIDKGQVLLQADIGQIDESAYTLTGPTSMIEPLLDGLNCIGTTTAGTVMSAHVFDKRIEVPDEITVSRLSLQDFFIHSVEGRDHE